MNQKDEFSKWISAVEEALQPESMHDVQPEMPSNDCGCGHWDCEACFPSMDQGIEMQPELTLEPEGHCPLCGASHQEDSCDTDLVSVPMDSDFEVEFNEGEPDIEDFLAKGGKIQKVPANKGPRRQGTSLASRHIGGSGDPMRPSRTGKAANTQGMPVVKTREDASGGGMSSGAVAVEEEDNDFIEKGSSGKGVKLGDIVQKTEFKKIGGQQSPMTYGEENLDEEPMQGYDVQDMDVETPDYQALQRPEASQIEYMQSLGLSKDNVHYTKQALAAMNDDELYSTYQRVMGEVTEAGFGDPRRAKTKHHLDDLEDILSPKHADLPAAHQPEAPHGKPGQQGPMELPTASAATTHGKVAGIRPSDTMRDFMNRINPDAGAAEPALPDSPENELVIRTASEVPAVISNAMQAAGVQSPEWHTINNLPGFSNRNIRGMGRQVFGMFTNTPVEQIKTIANVEGQGPNTDAEIRAVGRWLMNNAEDLGEVDVGHGMAIPGYRPDVKEYRANGIRFHVVRDPMGQYIYAYPDKDAVSHDGDQPALGMQAPRLRESEKMFIKPSLFEQLKWDEEIKEAFAEAELDESTLSKAIGKDKGGQKLVHWLHKKHKLSNEAELEPVAFNREVLWGQFKKNPDDFVIVSAENGVAGIKPYEKHIREKEKEAAKRGKVYNPAKDFTVPYQVIAFTDDGEQIDPDLLRLPPESGEDGEERYADPTVMKGRMGRISSKDLQNSNNTFEMLAQQIGRLKSVWISGFSGYRGDDPADIQEPTGSVEREKMAKRAAMKQTTEMPEEDALNMVFKRVRPVLKTLANQAISHIHRRMQRYMDGGNFEGAQKLAGTGQKLKQFLTTLDTSKDISLDAGYGAANRDFGSAIRAAVTAASGSRPGEAEYQQFLNDAAKGSAVNLKPILDSLRDKLVGL